MKQRIRLTESSLHRIIKETVKSILNEASYDMNSTEYKQMYDDGDKWYDGREDYDTRKEIADYEAMPDKARHPFGSDIPDFSDRINNRLKNVIYSDKLAGKEPNSILKKQQEKKEFQKDLDNAKRNYVFKNWCREKGINRENLQDDELVDLFRTYWEEKFEEQEKWAEYEDYLG